MAVFALVMANFALLVQCDHGVCIMFCSHGFWSSVYWTREVLVQKTHVMRCYTASRLGFGAALLQNHPEMILHQYLPEA